MYFRIRQAIAATIISINNQRICTRLPTKLYNAKLTGKDSLWIKTAKFIWHGSFSVPVLSICLSATLSGSAMAWFCRKGLEAWTLKEPMPVIYNAYVIKYMAMDWEFVWSIRYFWLGWIHRFIQALISFPWILNYNRGTDVVSISLLSDTFWT